MVTLLAIEELTVAATPGAGAANTRAEPAPEEATDPQNQCEGDGKPTAEQAKDPQNQCEGDGKPTAEQAKDPQNQCEGDANNGAESAEGKGEDQQPQGKGATNTIEKHVSSAVENMVDSFLKQGIVDYCLRSLSTKSQDDSSEKKAFIKGCQQIILGYVTKSAGVPILEDFPSGFIKGKRTGN